MSPAINILQIECGGFIHCTLLYGTGKHQFLEHTSVLHWIFFLQNLIMRETIVFKKLEVKFGVEQSIFSLNVVHSIVPLPESYIQKDRKCTYFV